MDDERKAATEARAVIRSLAPSTSLTDATKAILRTAGHLATNAIRGFSSDGTLDAARAEAGTAFSGLFGRSLSHEMIDRASRAVDAWLSKLPN
jgi:hypothetical protein